LSYITLDLGGAQLRDDKVDTSSYGDPKNTLLNGRQTFANGYFSLSKGGFHDGE
jgi:hypothetical protein